jgi:hypothetical protein
VTKGGQGGGGGGCGWCQIVASCEWSVLIRGPSPPLALGFAAVLALSGLARTITSMWIRRTRLLPLSIWRSHPPTWCQPGCCSHAERAQRRRTRSHVGGLGAGPGGETTALHYVETELTLLRWGMGSLAR